MKQLLTVMLLTLMTMGAQAQKVVKLWDNTTAPHSSGLTGPEKDEGEVRYSNTTEAVLYIFEAKKKVATGQAVVICPGGGYALVAMGHAESIFDAAYPTFDEKHLVESSFEYPVMVNGKLRFKQTYALDMTPADIEAAIVETEGAQKWLEGKAPKKIIVVKGKIINIVM